MLGAPPVNDIPVTVSPRLPLVSKTNAVNQVQRNSSPLDERVLDSDVPSDDPSKSGDGNYDANVPQSNNL